MADNIRAVTVGTVEDLEYHDTTRSRWGYSASETRTENSTSTPLRHLPQAIALDNYSPVGRCDRHSVARDSGTVACLGGSGHGGQYPCRDSGDSGGPGVS